jgi:purine-binding chemotaxis protein CheW
MLDQVVVFHVAGQRYALPIENVQEIQQIVEFSSVPGGDRSVLGMVNLRGVVIPALDARGLLGADGRERSLETPMVIAHVAGRLVALVVDEVEDVLGLPTGCMQDAPAVHALSSRLLGVARLESGLVYVLDADGLFVGAEVAA